MTNTRLAALAGAAMVALLVLVGLSYYVGHSDAQRGLAAAPAPSVAPVEEIVDSIPDYTLQGVCPAWRQYVGTDYESVIKASLLNGVHSSGPVPYADEDIWQAVRSRLNADCIYQY